ncbi:MAG TPA: S41 family peptidase [Spirochaetota bacterium]|nr:S41 family peptidase [Spirochaetota bacterium]
MIQWLKKRSFHIIVISFLAGIFIGVNIAFNVSAQEPSFKYLDFFHQVYQLIRDEYVEQPESKNLFYGAIRGMIASLNDPFSRFLDEQDFGQLKEETSGEFIGVGIEISAKNGDIVVVSPIDGTPAMKAGIQPGDIIYKIDNKPIKDKNINDIISLIRGKPHTKVMLSIIREGIDDPIDIELERLPIKLQSVNYAVIDNTDIGYLRIKVFSEDTSSEVKKALHYFQKNNIQKCIVDMRWNPGGLLDQAVAISDMFLPKDALIVSTKGRSGKETLQEYRSTTIPLYTGKCIILVNKGSASASEIVSGALKDNGRAKLLGEKTFGKGSVQKFFNLDEDTGITLTIAKYYTPSGVSIHGIGIQPDYTVTMATISKEEQKQINILLKEKILQNFIDKHSKYDEATRKEFKDVLEKNNIKLSDDTANFILKSEIYRFAKKPLYDLEFDNQLSEAMKIINVQ